MQAGTLSQSEEDRFAARVHELFRGILGQDVLRELELRHCRRVFDENSNRMAYKVGQSDLVQFLKELTEEGNGS